MILNCVFNSLRFDADVALRYGCGAVLQQSLNKGDVITIRIVDLCCVSLAEAMCADPLITQVVTHDFQLLLDCSFSDREN